MFCSVTGIPVYGCAAGELQQTSGFEIHANVGRVSRSENGDRVALDVQLADTWNELMSTSVTVQDEKIMVLGTTAGSPAGSATSGPRTRAYILTVTPIID